MTNLKLKRELEKQEINTNMITEITVKLQKVKLVHQMGKLKKTHMLSYYRRKKALLKTLLVQKKGKIKND
jgi:hypothetical protein